VLAVALALTAWDFARFARGVAGDASAQLDFRTYYWAARAWSLGEDPYALAALSRVAGEPVALPFLYPPVTLWAFRPFTLLAPGDAARLWLGLKLLALGGLLLLWLRVFVREGAGRLLLLALCVHGFFRPLRNDLFNGNVSIPEQLLVWGALALLLLAARGRQEGGPARARALLGFAVLLGVSAWFKLVTLALLPLAWVLLRTRAALAAVAAGLGVFALGTLPSLLLQPALVEGFRRGVAGLDERGEWENPSSWALMKDTAEGLAGAGYALPPLVLPGAWVLLALVVAGLGLWRGRRLVPGRDTQQLLALWLLGYALLVPRLKGYSYALLLVPAAWVLTRALHRRPLAALPALVLVFGGRQAPLASWPYLPLAALVALFALACLEGGTEGGGAAAGGAEGAPDVERRARPV
jgi:hypothetical protein